MVLITRHCSTCDGERDFERPPCADGHGADCTEWACVDCGGAILIGDPPEPMVVVRHARAA